jgi:hypothetical protein
LVGHISNEQGELGAPFVVGELNLRKELCSLVSLVLEFSLQIFNFSIVLFGLDSSVAVLNLSNFVLLAHGIILKILQLTFEFLVFSHYFIGS